MEAGHRVRNVRPTHIDAMRVTECIGLYSQ